MSCIALLAGTLLDPGCNSVPSPPPASSGDGGGLDATPSSGGSSASAGGGSSSGSNPGKPCDSGGPLALKAVWSLPDVKLSGVAVDGHGDVYMTGTFTGSVVFGTTTLTGPTTAGNENMFLAKYDAAGHAIFAQGYGTAKGIYTPPAIGVDSAGDAFLGGAFAGTLAWGGGTTPLMAVDLDAFAVKISPSGQTLWAERFGYDAGPYGVLSIAVGPDGDPVVGGTAAGPITLGGKTWQGSAAVGASQPFLAKLSTADGSVLWSNASGGDIDVGNVYVAVDSTGRAFLAARVDSGGGAWGVEAAAGVGYFATLRAGFAADGSIRWGQMDYGGLAESAAVDQAGRFSVVETTFTGVTVGASGAFGGADAGNSSLALLFSPTDGSVLSALNVGDTSPWSSVADGHGNTLLTGTFWQERSPIPVGGLFIPVVNGGAGQPLFVAALDGASNAVAVATMGPGNDAQPLGIAMDRAGGNVYVPGQLTTAFTSTVGPLQPGTFMAVFGPDPCDDGAGPAGAATGDASNHGDLGPDAASPYVPADASPAACPATQAAATNGAACPVPMGCSFGTTCCFCTPTACNGQATTWTCDPLGTPDARCPATPPAPQSTCPSGLQCNYCLSGGRFYAQCTAAGWATGYAQLLCQ
ncbi:MAG TPA: hypothetical protein VKU41_06030 [Polyangiaceae bacterium]|nr:hypothetical protein [Polyangiaceae bacterium]